MIPTTDDAATTVCKTKYLKNAQGLFVCPHCDQTKERQNTMFYHMKKHTGELKWACDEPGCGKSFVQKSGLTQHNLQVHRAENGTGGFACPCCEHRTPMKANMVIHIARKHCGTTVPAMTGACVCPSCQKSFASATAYYYHAAGCFQVAWQPLPVLTEAA